MPVNPLKSGQGGPRSRRYVGPLGGVSEVAPGRPVSPLAPLRAVNQTVSNALGVNADWMNNNWTPGQGVTTSGLHPPPSPPPAPPRPAALAPQAAVAPKSPLAPGAVPAPPAAQLPAVTMPPAPSPLAMQAVPAPPPVAAPTPQSPLLPPPGGMFNPNSSPEAAAINAKFPPIQPPAVRAPVSFSIGGVGLAPQSPAVEANIAGDQQIARQGNFRESMLANMNRGPTSAPAPTTQEPPNPFNVGKPFSSGVSSRYGQITQPDGSVKYVGAPTAETKAAKNMFDARRGGLAQRQEDYQQRRADNQGFRRDLVLDRARIRSEARSLRRGNLTFDERLAMKDPRAAAQRKVGEGSIAAAQSRDQALDAFRRDNLAAQERMSQDRNRTSVDIARSKVAAESGLDPATGKPINPLSPSQQVQQAQASPPDLENLSEEERKIAVQDLPPATQRRLLEEQRRADLQKKAADMATMPQTAAGNPLGGAVARWFMRPRSR